MSTYTKRLACTAALADQRAVHWNIREEVGGRSAATELLVPRSVMPAPRAQVAYAYKSQEFDRREPAARQPVARELQIEDGWTLRYWHFGLRWVFNLLMP